MPGTKTLTVSNEQLATQVWKVLADHRTLRMYNYPVARKWLDAAESWDGGDTIVIPWEDTEHSSPTALTTGYERWNDAVSTTMINGTMNPAWVVQPIMISEIDEKLNSGRGKVIDRAKKNAKNVNDHFLRNIQRVIMRGPTSSGSYVAPNGFTSWLTFNGVDFTTNGFFQNSSTGANTIHGVSQVAYAPATFPQFNNLSYDVASAAGTNLATMMFQSCIDLSIRDQWPTPQEAEWYCTSSCIVNLKKFMRTFEQYIDGKGNLDDGARRPIGPGGVPMVPIADMAIDGANTAASKMSALLVNWGRGVRPYLFQGWQLDTTGWSDIPGTAGVRAALMKLGGNTACLIPGLQVTIKNAETY